jgi:hypothetical protein
MKQPESNIFLGNQILNCCPNQLSEVKFWLMWLQEENFVGVFLRISLFFMRCCKQWSWTKFKHVKFI